LQKFDVKREQLNLFVTVPHKAKDKKICGFLEIKNDNVDTIMKSEFKNILIKRIEKLVAKYDFFIAQGVWCRLLQQTFGKSFGPAGKMPSPQLGILMNVDDKAVNELKNKINSSLKIKTKEGKHQGSCRKAEHERRRNYWKCSCSLQHCFEIFV